MCTRHSITFAVMEQNEIVQETAHLIEGPFDLTNTTVYTEDDLVKN